MVVAAVALGVRCVSVGACMVGTGAKINAEFVPDDSAGCVSVDTAQLVSLPVPSVEAAVVAVASAPANRLAPKRVASTLPAMSELCSHIIEWLERPRGFGLVLGLGTDACTGLCCTTGFAISFCLISLSSLVVIIMLLMFVMFFVLLVATIAVCAATAAAGLCRTTVLQCLCGCLELRLILALALLH